MKKYTFPFLSIFLFILIAASSNAQHYVRRINCGGDSLSLDEEHYDADIPFGVSGAGYIGGEPTTGDWGFWAGMMGGTHRFPIYSTYREGFAAYGFVVPPGGYLVKLYMSECRNHGPDRRIFDILVEDSLVLPHFDIYDKVGKDYAYEFTTWVRCDDGTLAVIMPASVGEPMLAAISVEAKPIDSIPPPRPEMLDATNGYNNIIIIWEPSRTGDVAGYRIQRRLEGGTSWETLSSLIHLYRFIDTTAVVGTNYQYRVAAVDVFGNHSAWTSPCWPAHAMSPSESPLPVYELFADSSQLAILADDPWAEDYVDASFAHDGSSWPDVEIRHRGNVSRGSSKKNWKIKFPSDDLFEDVRKLNLNGEFGDWTMLKNHYGFNLFCWTGIESPHADFGHLELNNEYFGVYVRLEQVDEAYLRHRGHSELDPIYKCNWEAFTILEDYSWCWEQETDCGWGDLEDIIELVNYTPDPDFAAMLDSAFDVESLLRYYAIIILTSDNDFSRHNLYLHRNLATGVWRLIPWDHNVAFDDIRTRIDLGTHFSPQTIGGPNILLTRLIQVDSYRDRFCDLLDSLSTSLFTLSSAIDYVDSAASLIRTDIYADYRKGTHENNAAWEDGIGHIAWFVNQRLEYVRPKIDSLRETTNRYGVFINEICALNDSTYADEHGDYDDWVELYNSNPWPVDLEGKFLSDDIDSLVYWELPDIAIPASGYLVLWLDGEPSEGPLHGPFRLDSDGEFLGLFDPMGEHDWWERCPPGIDLIWFGEQTCGSTWARYPDGENNWGFTDPTPGAPNSPTAIETPFAVIPDKLSINSIYPNPFNTRCRIELTGLSNVAKIEIFDLTGRLARTIGVTSVGVSSAAVVWDGCDNTGRGLPSGVYLIRARSGGTFTESKRIVMLK